MSGNRNLMNHCRNESSGIERYIGTSYDHLVKVSENMDTILFIARNIDSILEGVIVTTGDIHGQILELGKNMKKSLEDDVNKWLDLFRKDMDVTISEKLNFIDETMTGLVENSEFAIKQREFEARIDSMKAIQANDRETFAKMGADLTAIYGESEASISEMKEAIATANSVSAKHRETVNASIYNNELKLTEMYDSMLTRDTAYASRFDELQASIGDSNANVSELKNIVIENASVTAEILTKLESSVEGNNSSIEELKQTTSDLEGTTSKLSERLESTIKGIGDLQNLDTIKSSILLETLTEATNSKTSATRDNQMSSRMGYNEAQLRLQQITLATESEVRASQTLGLQAQVKDNTAQLRLDQLVLATEVETRASQNLYMRAEFTKKVGDLDVKLTADLTETKRVLTDADKALAESITKLSATVGGNKSEYDKFLVTYANDNKALTQTLEQLKAEVGDNISAEISDIKNTIAEVEKTSATSTLNLKSELETKIERDLLSTSNKIVEDTDTKFTNLGKEIDTKFNSTNTTLEQQIVESRGRLTDLINKNKESADKALKTSEQKYQEALSVVDANILKLVNDALETKEAITETEKALRDTLGESVASLNKQFMSSQEFTTLALDNLGIKITDATSDFNSKINTTNKAIDTKVNAAKTDLNKSTDSKIASNKTAILKEIDTKITTGTADIRQQQKDLDGKITTTSGKIDAVSVDLKNQVKDLEKEVIDSVTIKDTRNDNQPPSWYYANYPSRKISEFKNANTIGIPGKTSGYADLTTTVSWRDSSGGDIVQEAMMEGTLYMRHGGAKGKPDTWSAWSTMEDITSAQAKANKAKTDAINESKKYADSIDTRINTKITAEIKQVNQTIATVDGQVAAMTRLTAETSVLGSKVISGIAFGSDNKKANFKVFADNFAIVSTDGRTEVPAFTSTMVGGKAVVGINGSLFVKNSISGDVIKANSTLSSPNIVGGQLNIGNGKFRVDTNGNVAMRANASSNVGMVITNEAISVYDAQGRLRVKMGKIR